MIILERENKKLTDDALKLLIQKKIIQLILEDNDGE